MEKPTLVPTMVRDLAKGFAYALVRAPCAARDVPVFACSLDGAEAVLVPTWHAPHDPESAVAMFATLRHVLQSMDGDGLDVEWAGPACWVLLRKGYEPMRIRPATVLDLGGSLERRSRRMDAIMSCPFAGRAPLRDVDVTVVRTCDEAVVLARRRARARARASAWPPAKCWSDMEIMRIRPDGSVLITADTPCSTAFLALRDVLRLCGEPGTWVAPAAPTHYSHGEWLVGLAGRPARRLVVSLPIDQEEEPARCLPPEAGRFDRLMAALCRPEPPLRRGVVVADDVAILVSILRDICSPSPEDVARALEALAA